MNLYSASVATYIDPPSPAYFGDRLFDLSDPVLNRDDSLLPYSQVRECLRGLEQDVHTADLLPAIQSSEIIDYYSLGVLERFKELSKRPDVRLRAFVIFEPPVVEPRLYNALPEISKAFEEVYLHNVDGDGYSLKGVDRSKLRKLYWPQPRRDVIEPYWSNCERQRRVVVINGNHVPRPVPNELYSKRIEAMAALASTGRIDLYGRGWARWWSRSSMWLPYWRHRRALMSIYKGSCESKYEILSHYHFSLCLENMAMQGYVTEKIFDCFYTGTIPVYLGAPDIADLIPQDAYVSCSSFSGWSTLLDYLLNLGEADILHMRNAGRAFVRSIEGEQYRNSLRNIFKIRSESHS
jgi:alpha(1,3/1,4) fucosyltransferase